KTGTHTFIDGAQVHGQKDLAGYPATAQHLAAQSGADTFKDVQSFVNNGGVNAAKLLGVGGKLAPPTNGKPASSLTDANNELHQKLVDRFGAQNVDTAFRVQAGVAGGLGALGGLAGAVSSTNDLADGIRSQDYGKIAT